MVIKMDKWETLASEESINKAVAALKANGIDAIVAENGAAAKKKVFEILPLGAEVMTMTSMTLDALGITPEIVESGKYNPVRKKLMAMDWKSDGRELRSAKLGSAPDWAVGSVHAVTEDGKVVVASATGSQLPAYAYGSKVIWVAGTQKIVKNLDEAFKRIYDYTFPLEDVRAKKAYGVNSSVSKLLIFNREMPGRITLIFVREKLGF